MRRGVRGRTEEGDMTDRHRGRVRGVFLVGLLAGLPWVGPAATAAEDGPHARQALFGDLHVHTINSFDAYGFGVRATPDDAYRYAKGEAIAHMLGYEVQLRSGPLDFYGVTDHAVYLGAMRALHDPDGPLHAHPLARELIDNSNPVSPNVEGPSFVAAIINGRRVAGFDAAEAMRSAWRRTVDAAERHNDPGTFTTFIGYEYNVLAAGADPASQRDLRRQRGVRLPVHHGGLPEPGEPVALDGRPAGCGNRRAGDSAQLQPEFRPDVRAGGLGGPADRRGVRRAARAQRTAGRSDPGQGYVGDASRPLARGRLGRLRDRGAARAGARGRNGPGFLRARRVARRAVVRGGDRGQPVPVRTDRLQ